MSEPRAMRLALVLAALAGAACADQASARLEQDLATERDGSRALARRVAELEAEVARLSARAPCVPDGAAVVDRGTVKIKVTSQPPDADVFVDGRKVGRTPFEFDAATPSFVLRVEKVGYQTAAQTVNAAAPAEINVPLSKNQ